MLKCSMRPYRLQLAILNASKTLPIVLCLMLLGAPSFAQVIAPTDTIAPPIPGVGHNYIGMLNETVNPENGGVSLRLAVPVPPGRKLTLPFSFNYDSTETLFFQGNWELGYGLRPSYNSAPFAVGGWSYGLPRLDNFTESFSAPFPSGVPSDGSTVCGTTASYTFTDVDGSSHQLGLSHIYDNGPGFYGSQNWQCVNSHFIEADTSVMDPIYQAMLTNLSSGATDPDTAGPSDGQPEVAAPDGTLYTFPGSGCGTPFSPSACSRLPATIEDKDGNVLTFSENGNGGDNPQAIISATNLNGFSVTDTAGRLVLNGQNFGTNGSTVSVSGLPNPYTLSWVPQSSYSGYSVTKTDVSGPLGAGVCSPSGALSTGPQTQSFLSAITLPNGKAYQFTQDPQYGTLSKVTYPSGGYIRYVYGLNPASANVNSNGLNGAETGFNNSSTQTLVGACEDILDTVAVQHRYVSFDGKTEVQRQDFSYSTTWNGINWSKKQTTVVTNDLLRGTAYSTTYAYVPIEVFPPPNGGNVVTLASVEQQVTYSDTSGAVLETVTKGWKDQYTLACEVDTIGSAGLSSAVFYSYGPGDVVTDKKEYDYGLVSPASCYNGAVAPTSVQATRETATSYQAFASTTFPAPSLLSAPCRATVTNSAGAIVSETDSYYDNGSSVCSARTPSVVAVPNLPGGSHDEGLYGPHIATARGDTTRVDRKNNLGATATTVMSYDETGQVISSLDPCGNSSCSDMTGTNHTTQYTYTDSPSGGNPSGNSNAYVTQINYPTTSNGYGHQTSFSYSYTDGKVISSTDENGQTTHYKYDTPPSGCGLQDGLDRLSESDYPDGGTTTYCYNDAAPTPSTTTSKLLNANGTWQTSVNQMDGMGHVTLTQLTSDPAGADEVNTVYDGEGLVYTKSNPFRPNAPSSTDGTSTFYYDALARKIEEIEADGNKLQWSYNGMCSTPSVTNCATAHLGSVAGTWVDTTDERGNHWQRTSDSFGRLTEVMEPTGSTQSPSMETDYSYDALNNLLSVNQKGTGSDGSPRTRSFTYDSLSRLITSSNPETGTIGYSYDPNSNLSSRTDARGITTNYTYDVLNRMTLKTYSDEVTPTVYYVYDLSSVTGPNKFAANLTNTIGRLANTCVSGNQNCTSEYSYSYDAMGRVIQQWTALPGANTSGEPVFGLQTQYDLAGNVIQRIYPDHLTLTQGYDAASHLTSITSSNAQFPTSLFASPSYSPPGGLTGVTFGAGLVLNRSYDSRLRVTGETDTGGGVASPTPGNTVITVIGPEQPH